MSKLKTFINRIFASGTPEKKNNTPLFPSQIADANCTPEFIAKGTFGSVYKVLKNGRNAAVKVLECTSEYEFSRAKKECVVMKSLVDDAYTVNYLDHIILSTDHGHTVYILQEYLTTFESYYSPEHLSQSEIIRLGIDICQAIISCRKAGFYHLDIQPKNIFVTETGTFKLGDFGSAVSFSELNKPLPLLGTPSYMAPEVYEGRLYSETSDIYSLGILLYSLLNHGILPFANHTSKEEAIRTRMNKHLLPLLPIQNRNLSQALSIACHPTPGQRFQTTEDMLAQLQSALTEEQSHTIPQSSAVVIDLGSSSIDFTTYPSAPPLRANASEFTCPSPQPPQLFDADSLAFTCAVMEPPHIFDADSLAFTCAVMEPPHIFDADSLAFTCAVMEPPHIFDADSLAFTCQVKAPEPPPAPKMSEVQFSAIAPETAIKGDYTMVQLYMYEQAYAYIMDEALKEADGPVVSKTSGFYEVAQHARIKVVLTSPDVEILEGEDEQIWYGKYLTFDFAFEIPFDFAKKQILLKATVYINDLPVTKLLLKLKTGTVCSSIEVERNDITHVYMSYAREDQAKVVSLVQAIQTVRPEWEVFFDLYSLKCGSDWESTLYKNLEICDTLFLCWSRSASVSPWVDKEWRYMLSSKGLDSIEPMPVEPVELCPPPKELSAKYFNNNLLYLANPFGT